MTTLTLQPGLRPAQLPPTLQPHAVLSLAPPTDRRRSALISAAVYTLLGGGLLWIGRVRAEAKPVFHPMGPVVILDPAPFQPALPAFHPVAQSHAEVPVLVHPPVLASQVIPETPGALPSQDLSHEVLFPPVSNPADGTTGTGSAPITLSGDAVRVLHQVDPVYPTLAMAAHLQGQVVIRMTIDERGLPSEVVAVSGPRVFQEPALRAARQWHFEPARENGRPVPATFLLNLNFVLR